MEEGRGRAGWWFLGKLWGYPGVLGGSLGGPWEFLGGPWGSSGEILGGPWGSLGGPWGVLGDPLEVPWGSLGGPARGGCRRKIERNRCIVLNAGFWNFPRLFRQKFSRFGRRCCFFDEKMQDSPSETHVFQECTSGALFAAPGPKRPPRRFPGSPQRCENSVFFSWEAPRPGLEKVEDSSSETRV